MNAKQQTPPHRPHAGDEALDGRPPPPPTAPHFASRAQRRRSPGRLGGAAHRSFSRPGDAGCARDHASMPSKYSGVLLAPSRPRGRLAAPRASPPEMLRLKSCVLKTRHFCTTRAFRLGKNFFMRKKSLILTLKRRRATQRTGDRPPPVARPPAHPPRGTTRRPASRRPRSRREASSNNSSFS